MEKSGADNVGGRVDILPIDNSMMARAIALCLSSFFGAGNAHYKTSLPKKSVEVDTVFGGCYRREVFDKIGLFDERMIRSQDMELNMRLKKAGGKIMMFPDIAVNYYPKSNFRDFFIHNFWDGFWAVWPLKFIKMPLKARHYAPLFFVLLLAGMLILGTMYSEFLAAFFAILAAYAVASLLFAAKIAIKEKNAAIFFLTPFAFATRHFGYGLGSFWGIISLIMPQKNGGKNQKRN